MAHNPDRPAELAQAAAIPRLTVRQLAYLVAVAQHESIAGASQSIGIAAAAISAAISQAEAITGAQLFTRRHARGMVLTQAGRDVVTEARTVLASLRDMETVHQPGQALVGRLDVGCILTLAPHLLPPLVRAFRDAHPQLLIRVHQADQEMLLRGLEDGRLDAAMLFDLNIPGTVRGIGLRAMPLQAVLPLTHALARGQPVPLQALAHEPFVLLDLPHSRDYILSAFAEAGSVPRIAHRVSSPELARGLVAQGFGYSLLNFCPPTVLPGQPRVVSVPLAGQHRAATLLFARLYRARTPRSIETLMNIAAACAAALAINAGSDFTTPNG